MRQESMLSLEKALNLSIQHMVNSYSSHWLLFDGVHELQQNPGLITAREEQFEKAVEPDSHPFTEIFICVEGQCAMHIPGRLLPVQAGQVVIILPGLIHCEMPNRYADHLGIWLTIDMNRCILHLSGKNARQGFFTVEGRSLQPDSFNLIFNQLKEEIFEPGRQATEMMKAYLLQMLILALRLAGNDQDELRTGRQWADTIVSDVKAYIAAHYVKPLRLDEICQAVCISSNYLNTLFKSATGQTITQYIAEFKLEKARQLLLHTEQSIQEIAAGLGYYDPYHFSKTFKKAMGMSPSQYRKCNYTSIQ